MVAKISNKLSLALCKSNAISQEEIEVYAYGIQLVILSILDWSVTFFIMFLIKEVILSVIYFCVFMSLRHQCGGYHAKTHLRCLIASNIVYIASIYLSQQIWLHRFVLVCEIINLLIIYKCAPIEHENKPIEEEDLLKHKKNGRILNYFISCVALVLYTLHFYEYALIILFGQLSVSLAILLQKIKQMKGVDML